MVKMSKFYVKPLFTVRRVLTLQELVGFCESNIINNIAALVKSEVSWDNIDDAQLTPEQVADLALDMVDNDLLNIIFSLLYETIN